jgi:type II secretory pathway component GspD/PulD (secretin)
MRKRILIGLLAIAVIGVVAFVVSRPGKGTLEWHKKEYLAASNRLAENRFRDRLRRIYYAVTQKAGASKLPIIRGKSNLRTATERNMLKLEQHRKALVEHGYLNERHFALKYQPVDLMKINLANTLLNRPNVINARVWLSTEGDTILVTTRRHVMAQSSVSTRRNTIVVTAPRDVIAKYDELIPKLDQP